MSASVDIVFTGGPEDANTASATMITEQKMIRTQNIFQKDICGRTAIILENKNIGAEQGVALCQKIAIISNNTRDRKLNNAIGQ